MAQVGAWWIAIAFLLTAGGALYELWRKQSRIGAGATAARAALLITVVLAVVGIVALLGWLPSPFVWAAPAAFFVAWLEYLSSFSRRPEAS